MLLLPGLLLQSKKSLWLAIVYKILAFLLIRAAKNKKGKTKKVKKRRKYLIASAFF
jgi:hypothetical protein